MKRATKIVIGAVALVAVAATIGAISAARRGKVVQVRIEAAESRDLESVVNASGWVRPNRKVDVQADIMGRITSLQVKEGDRVRRDQVLLRIDPSEYESAVERARCGQRVTGTRGPGARQPAPGKSCIGSAACPARD